MKPGQPIFQPRIRVMNGRDIALGPGKAELLEQLQKSGSITRAAKRMGMSYMRAWMLIKTMQRCFKEPLIQVARGGARHGGAELTANGRRALELYREMEEKSVRATQGLRREMKRLLRK
jgi:molybdate transport system regulatory protein